VERKWLVFIPRGQRGMDQEWWVATANRYFFAFQKKKARPTRMAATTASPM
jgi:hypothetical protein